MQSRHIIRSCICVRGFAFHTHSSAHKHILTAHKDTPATSTPLSLPSTPLSLPPLTQNQPWVPSLVQTLSQILPQWRRDHAGLPVLTWANFYNKVVDCINPLASEEKTRVVASALHDTGEVCELWGVVCREKKKERGGYDVWSEEEEKEERGGSGRGGKKGVEGRRGRRECGGRGVERRGGSGGERRECGGVWRREEGSAKGEEGVWRKGCRGERREWRREEGVWWGVEERGGKCKGRGGSMEGERSSVREYKTNSK